MSSHFSPQADKSLSQVRDLISETNLSRQSTPLSPLCSQPCSPVRRPAASQGALWGVSFAFPNIKTLNLMTGPCVAVCLNSRVFSSPTGIPSGTLSLCSVHIPMFRSQHCEHGTVQISYSGLLRNDSSCVISASNVHLAHLFLRTQMYRAASHLMMMMLSSGVRPFLISALVTLPLYVHFPLMQVSGCLQQTAGFIFVGLCRYMSQ